MNCEEFPSDQNQLQFHHVYVTFLVKYSKIK
jgi:hypothetical protein